MPRAPFFACLFLCAPLLLWWPTIDPVLEGSVRSDANHPIAAASVRRQGRADCTRSDALGRFKLPAGSGRVTATKPGFRIGWVSSADKPLRIQLAPLPTEDHDGYTWIAPDADAGRPSNCANCHQEIYRQWSAGAHARSATNPKLLALLGGDESRPSRADWNLRAQHPDGAGVCVGCHAPTFQDPTLEYDLRAVKDVTARGVHCDYCHKIAAAPTDKLGTRFGRDGYPLLRPKDGDLLTFGPLNDAVRPGESFAHAPFYKESRYCASCHEGVLFGVHVYGTYSEWLDSPAAKAGRQCQDCHMAPTGKMTNVAPGRGGIERDPKTLANHDFPGGTPEMLRKCLQLDVTVDRGKERFKVVAELRANKVGHRVPTGFIDRHLVLVVEAFDIGGQPIAATSGPKLDAAAGPDFVGHAGRLYAKKLHAAGRSPLPFWIAPDGSTDTRLHPDRPDRQEFFFPPAATHIRTRLLYRRFWAEVADAFAWQDNELLVIERRAP